MGRSVDLIGGVQWFDIRKVPILPYRGNSVFSGGFYELG